MVLNATFNNSSAISRRLVLLVEETGGAGENHRPAQVSDTLFHIILYRIRLVMSGIRTHNVTGDRH